MTAIYKVRAGVSTLRTDEQAQLVGEHLEATFGEQPITPAMVVAEAVPKASPLHEHFEWNDAKAAGAHRENQARALMRSIVVVREDAAIGGRPPRAYHSVALLTEDGAQRAYLAERVVWRNPELADQVVARALGELRGWRARYGEYRELASAVKRVDEALLS